MVYLLKNTNETPRKIVLNCYISFFQIDTFRFAGFTCRASSFPSYPHDIIRFHTWHTSDGDCLRSRSCQPESHRYRSLLRYDSCRDHRNIAHTVLLHNNIQRKDKVT